MTADHPQDPPPRSRAAQLHHDLRSALGAAAITLETLQVLESEDRSVAEAKRAAMLDRAIAALREANRVVEELEAARAGGGVAGG